MGKNGILMTPMQEHKTVMRAGRDMIIKNVKPKECKTNTAKFSEFPFSPLSSALCNSISANTSSFHKEISMSYGCCFVVLKAPFLLIA